MPTGSSSTEIRAASSFVALASLGPDGVNALATASHLHRLTSLGLRRSRIGDGGLAALATSTVFGNLESLEVSDSLTDKDLFALAASKCLPKLRHVTLAPWGSQLFTQEGIDAVKARFAEVTVRKY